MAQAQERLTHLSERNSELQEALARAEDMTTTTTKESDEEEVVLLTIVAHILRGTIP